MDDEEAAADPNAAACDVVAFARLFDRAAAIFETEDGAREWLTTPQHGLNGIVPLEHARTETGARQVETLLGRIEYGTAL